MASKQGRAPLPLWTAARAWWSDTAAQDCGSFSWPFILVIFIASTIAISLPFGANRWREAESISRTSQYPGLGTAFEALARADVSFAVSDGKLQTTSGVQSWAQEAGGWLIRVDANNTPEGSEMERSEEIASDTKNLLQLGPDHFLVRNGTTGIQLNASLLAFEGFSSEILQQAAADRRILSNLIEGLLFTAAFASIPSAILTLGLLMLVQNMAFVVILGIMLSFAVYRKKLWDEQGPTIRPLEGIKMAAAIMSGPAFLIGLVGLFIPAFQAPFLWLAYSLLAGIRVIVLYTSRYRSAGRPQLP